MRRIARVALVAAACVATPGFADDQKPARMEEVLTMRVEGTIAVDATGKVIAHEVKTGIPPRLRELIDNTVPAWRFFPPMVDGAPSAAKTDMRITLLGRKDGDGYEVSIDNVLFSKTDPRGWRAGKESTQESSARTGDDATLSLARKRPLPVYPPFNVNGMVTVLLNIAPDGEVIDAVPMQCSLYQASGSDFELARACKAMSDNAATAIKRWTVAIDTHGKPLPTKPLSATLPVQFIGMQGGNLVTKASQPGHWRVESRTPYRVPEWARGERFAQRMGTSDAVGSGDLMSSDSPLRLQDGQLGRAL